MPRKRAPSLVEVAIKRVGFRKAQRVFAFVAAFAIAQESISKAGGKERISIEDYGDWWKESRSTSYRDQALFRECFPEFESVHDVLALAHAARREASFLGLSKVQFVT